MDSSHVLKLYFYSILVEIKSQSEHLLAELRRDFSYFLDKKEQNSVAIEITCDQALPDYTLIDKPFFFKTHDARCYGWGDMRFVRYDMALCMYNARTQEGRVIAEKREALHFHTYYMVISKVGELLDLKGLHRVHSLGVHVCGATVLFPMTIGGGKSTLCMHMLKKGNVSLYSEDTPLVDSRGYVYPFPVCLALADVTPYAIPAQYVRTMNDSRFRNKCLVDITYIQESICTGPALLTAIMFGERHPEGKPTVRKMSRIIFLCYLCVHVIKGKEFPQKKEYVFRVSPRCLLGLMRILFSRIMTAYNMFCHFKPYRFMMSSDIPSNVAFIADFISQGKGL